MRLRCAHAFNCSYRKSHQDTWGDLKTGLRRCVVQRYRRCTPRPPKRYWCGDRPRCSERCNTTKSKVGKVAPRGSPIGVRIARHSNRNCPERRMQFSMNFACESNVSWRRRWWWRWWGGGELAMVVMVAASGREGQGARGGIITYQLDELVAVSVATLSSGRSTGRVTTCPSKLRVSAIDTLCGAMCEVRVADANIHVSVCCNSTPFDEEMLCGEGAVNLLRAPCTAWARRLDSRLHNVVPLREGTR
jgi:hypothetical protein